ncbi:MAG: tRNA uridine-5-carboxymethylaminomethyl(34) synthesis GTPase MnmE [Faecalibacterium sp.]|nr:tRNA uridine-5-carboxymethylaminomethyl(34) synthesis GTPase MnmE [Ruminococcus sp.]MCM1391378.1 tRNA uridine-5-carboxymethylaminomethyl(34) synthesis GTPase MnmE [Ruminococcus sp.]MCM1484588.1 tRNA uridine-5-carboxymethylaminomethyl(34) synthesis GTPase MnmE [Faecalibacterium sp.]
MTDSTIAAISTPQNTGGIGVIRISGEDAIVVADKIFQPTGKKKLCELSGYTAAHGKIVFDGEPIDECVALVFRAPKSYTGENVVELSCHGGLFVLKRVLRAVFESGAKPAEAGEFTKRAFMNGKIDLTEAEAVMGIINAQGEQGAKAALNALDGALSKKISALNHELLSAAAHMSAWVDYPDDDIEELDNSVLLGTLENVRTELKLLLYKFDAGSAITKGVETAIVGKPNVGKSALMNLLSGFSRSIVTDVAGTTRDVVEQTVNLGAVLLHLADTAGIHETDDIVESIGVDRARQRIDRAGLILAVFDSSMPLNDADTEIMDLCKGKRAIAVINKTDLPKQADIDVIKQYIPNTVELCAMSGDGLSELEQLAEKLLCVDDLDTSAAMLSTERQRKNTVMAVDALNDAISCLKTGVTMDAVNVCVDTAIGALLELTGEKAQEAVVNEVFSQFCVGK